jgi:16S rRNA (guanine1207-N2)-methyltransferase
MTEHYFSATPQSEYRTKEITVRLAHQDVVVETASGIFSPDHIDAGTQALLFSVPALPSEGTFLDVGCGWGPLALTMALEAPGASVWAVDVNERSCELTQKNATRLGCNNIQVRKPNDVDPELRFDVIWTNPPIRVGKAELHAILSTWLPRLNRDGQAYLVVAKHLGADSLEKWLAAEFSTTHTVTRADTRKGFRVIKVSRNN